MPKTAKDIHPLAKVRELISTRFPMSQQELADLLDCSRGYIQRLETKKTPLVASMAQRIDAVLGTDFVVHLERGEPDEAYSIDPDQIIESFVDRQFKDLTTFNFDRGQLRMNWDAVYAHSTDKKMDSVAFKWKVSRKVHEAYAVFLEQIEKAVDDMPVKSNLKPGIVGEILDSISSGHPFFLLNHFVWEQAKAQKLTFETAWEQRKWVELLNAKYGQDVNVAAFYKGAENDPTRFMLERGKMPIPDDERTVEEANRNHVSKVERIRSAQAKRKK